MSDDPARLAEIYTGKIEHEVSDTTKMKLQQCVVDISIARLTKMFAVGCLARMRRGIRSALLELFKNEVVDDEHVSIEGVKKELESFEYWKNLSHQHKLLLVDVLTLRRHALAKYPDQRGFVGSRGFVSLKLIDAKECLMLAKHARSSVADGNPNLLKQSEVNM